MLPAEQSTHNIIDGTQVRTKDYNDVALAAT